MEMKGTMFERLVGEAVARQILLIQEVPVTATKSEPKSKLFRKISEAVLRMHF